MVIRNLLYCHIFTVCTNLHVINVCIGQSVFLCVRLLGPDRFWIASFFPILLFSEVYQLLLVFQITNFWLCRSLLYAYFLFCYFLLLSFSSVQFSHSVGSDSWRPHELQHARPPCPSPNPGVYPNSCPSSRWCHPTISSSVIPSPPAPYPSQHQGIFQWVSSLHEVAKVLELQLQHQSFQWTPRTGLL